MSGPNRSFNLWDPVGDSGALRRAAGAWRAMANDLRELDGALNAKAGASHSFWTGKAGDAFRTWHQTNLAGTLPDEAASMDSMAGQLDQAADQIDRANGEIHELEIEIAATAVVGGILGFVTFGATEAAALAADAAMAARAAAVLERLAMILRSIAVVLRTLFTALGREFVESLVYNTLITGVVKAWQDPDHNPFENWSTWDLLGIVVTAGIQAPINVGVGRVFNMASAARAGESIWSEPFSAAKAAASPLTIAGFTIRAGWITTAIREGSESALAGALTWGVRDEIENLSGFQHHSWRQILRDAAIGGTLNLIVGSVAGGLSGAGVGSRFGLSASHRSYVRASKASVRPLINGPTTALLGHTPLGWPVGGIATLRSLRGAPGLSVPLPNPPPLHRVGGGVHRVTPGESLWQIAQRAYGDPRLWPILLHDNGTAITNPNLIFAGQRIEVPALPAEELRHLLRRLQSTAA